jgi:protein-disulfide isomerase
MNRKLLFISGISLIILAFVTAVVLYQQQAGGSQTQALLERPGAPVKGPHDAKVTIVEFFDPACGTCADFYPLVQQLIDQYPGKVRVLMRYAPLHSGSDQVVLMLEAAHRQGKYWQALEMLFNNQRRWIISHVSQPGPARALLNAIAMDHAQLDADMANPDVIGVLQTDIQDLQTLGVRATPEFFVNGKPLPSFGYRQLAELVKEAVEDSY